MSIIDDGANRDESPSPLFASSWMALYLLLKQEFDPRREAPREEQAAEDARTPGKPS